MSELTVEEKAMTSETRKHIHRVGTLLHRVASELMRRADQHDLSKLSPPEVSILAEHTPKLAGLTYGSDEYYEVQKAMRPAIEHHYRNNPHHPEFHQNGIDDMTLIDLVEMICDWKAATERHRDGDIQRSLDLNKDRFKMSDQLVIILRHTACFLNKEDEREATLLRSRESGRWRPSPEGLYQAGLGTKGVPSERGDGLSDETGE